MPVFHPDARREMRQARDFYDLERKGLGDEFVDAVERTIGNIVANPESSPAVLRHIRKRVVTRFPYAIIYAVREDDIFISAVAHDSRRPFYWQDRL